MQHAILRKFEAIAGVEAVSISTGPPMEGSARNPLLVADRDYGQGTLPPVRLMRDVSPGFAQSIGARLLAGRDLNWDDLYGFRRVCLVTENLARELWGTPQSALGQRVRRDTNADWSQIVGVMSDIRDDGLNRDAPKAVYWPLLQGTVQRPGVSRHVDLLIRSPRAASSSFIAELKRALAEVNPNLPLANVRTLETYYRRALARTSFTMILLAVAAAMALTMGIIGIYGVIAYSVSRRRRDIGIRIALGSSIAGVTRIFLREGLMVSAVGAVIGLIGALAAARWMESLLYGITPADPLTYALVFAALIAAATLASWLPARRAATVDPIETLRAE
ncbi:MAG: FtsX-like permease family protein [Bryobacterales bacterium]|nr:FtsX-like permease family protein [Bryobacterales bacterium]